jgi:peroxiredoxin Q/BCP
MFFYEGLPMRIFIVLVCIGLLMLFGAKSVWAKKVNAGSPAPSFSLRDYTGQEFSLEQARRSGLWVVLVFYPKDDSPVCTKQLCKIRDLMPKIPAWIKVVGISNGDAASHRAFAEKHHLPFTLLIDSKNHVRKLYRADVWGGRVTIIINPQGHIVKTCSDMLSLGDHIGMIENLAQQQQ